VAELNPLPHKLASEVDASACIVLIFTTKILTLIEMLLYVLNFLEQHAVAIQGALKLTI
jgi:hypothetical protein